MQQGAVSIRASVCLHVAMAVLLARAAAAQDPAPVPATGPSAAVAPFEPQFQVIDLLGVGHSGRLLSVAPEITLVDDRGENAFGWADILELRPLAPVEGFRPPVPSGWRFELADGSSIFGRIVGDDADRVVVDVPGGESVKIGLADARSLVLTDASEPTRKAFSEQAALTEAVDDAVILMKGDEPVVLRGGVTRWTQAQVQFRWKDRDLPIPWEKLAGVVLGRPAPTEQPTVVHLRSGARLAGRVIGGDAREITLESPSLGRRTVAWPAIERVEARSGRMAFLSDIPPRLYEFTPFLDYRWEPVFDRSLPGGPITLGGRTYSKGVSMHSQSRLIYAINRAARQFAATVGISDEMGRRGAVDVIVIGDGQTLWEARGVRGGDEPREILVDVASVEVLELRVEFGDDLDLSDQVCWAFARLIR